MGHFANILGGDFANAVWLYQKAIDQVEIVDALLEEDVVDVPDVVRRLARALDYVKELTRTTSPLELEPEVIMEIVRFQNDITDRYQDLIELMQRKPQTMNGVGHRR